MKIEKNRIGHEKKKLELNEKAKLDFSLFTLFAIFWFFVLFLILLSP